MSRTFSATRMSRRIWTAMPDEAPFRTDIAGTSVWELLLIEPGPRPVVETSKLIIELCAGLWAGCHGTDSDGDWNEVSPVSEWRYWYQARRPKGDEWFVVEAIGDDPLVFSINGTSAELVVQVADFFLRESGGQLSADAALATQLRQAQ